ncbi:MAG: hypothetical protein KJ592_03920 [Nanoarchaeota archaeon]|nr:hypothetical protein [Nanoarchaeota archaeon]
MGKEKYQKQIEELFRKSPVVSFSSIERIVREKKNVKQYAKQLVRNLILKGKIKRIAKGYYSVCEDPVLNVFCFQPSYLGLQDALSFYGIWEQETIPVIITSKRIRQGLRETDLGNILIRRIDKKYLFGIEYKKQGDFYVPYSDVEKTFIDMIYFGEKMSEEVLVEIKKGVDGKKLESYLKKYPKRFVNKVLGVRG